MGLLVQQDYSFKVLQFKYKRMEVGELLIEMISFKSLNSPQAWCNPASFDVHNRGKKQTVPNGTENGAESNESLLVTRMLPDVPPLTDWLHSHLAN